MEPRSKSFIDADGERGLKKVDAPPETAVVLQQLLTAVEEIRQELRGTRKPWYTVAEIAELACRSDYTVRRWIAEKRIRATRVTGSGPKGRLMVAQDELRKLI